MPDVPALYLPERRDIAVVQLGTDGVRVTVFDPFGVLRKLAPADIALVYSRAVRALTSGYNAPVSSGGNAPASHVSRLEE